MTISDEDFRDLAERLDRAEQKADSAAQVALGSVETIKHMQSASEHQHAKEGDQLAAMRKMVNMVEAMAKQILVSTKDAKDAKEKKAKGRRA